MSNYQALIGRRIGHLTVELFIRFNQYHLAFLSCRCDCGKLVERTEDQLRFGRLIHCGCKIPTKRGSVSGYTLPFVRRGERRDESTWLKSLRHLYSNYERGAKKRGYEWGLTLEQFYDLTQEDCHYCGVSPSQEHSIHKNDPIVYNGIDRLDNKIGYDFDNCVPCCGHCNKSKAQRGAGEFLDWARRIALRHVS